MNAGLYVFATIVLLYGFAVQLSSEPKSGLVLILIGLALIIFVNVHDLLAHLAGIDYRLPLMEFDVQLGLVEFPIPVVQITSKLLYFLGILFIFIQEQKIKEGQYMMGLKDEIFYFSLFITYALQILMPIFPGQQRYIRKNLFHTVFIVDPASICGLEASFIV
ncbi:uncharacterized protein LOC132272558 [Cornus florida]|uniref:uncharacterized protein LOC132272558 n=1 Tax=Cornus florida TaxID=4283 RepID=UPI0028983BAA|nr:uncharacterized protein LOC132272558 [Cornus florida]